MRIGDPGIEIVCLDWLSLCQKFASMATLLQPRFPPGQCGILKILTDYAGDPMRMVHHLGFGLYSFLMQPAAGFVSSREQGLSAILHGLEEGIKALVSNVIIAITNATAKATSQGRRSLVFLGLEQDSHGTFALSPQLQWHGGLQLALHSADLGLLNALLAGLVGVLAEPVR